MPRASFNVHVLPFRISQDTVEYAVLRCAGTGIWQGIAGGGEDDEKPLEAAKRKSFEECGIPVFYFAGDFDWGDDVHVIPQYAFGVDAASLEIRLSEEHTDYRWLTYEKAFGLLHNHNHNHNTKHDLWELNQRLKGKGPRG